MVSHRFLVPAAFLSLIALGAAFSRAWLPAAPSPSPAPPALAAAGGGPAEDLSAAFKRVAAAARPSVVTILTTARFRQEGSDRWFTPFEDPFFERFFGDDWFRRLHPQAPREFQRSGVGSGVVTSPDGVILTNNHVVDGADEIQVVLEDGRSLPAKVAGADESFDLAVLRVEADDLTPLPFGDSDLAEVGDWVLAVGSPFGLQASVSAGIVSAVGRVTAPRAIQAPGASRLLPFEDFIQTDAAINPGNSGGPLLNLRGEVIGIAVAIPSLNGVYNGYGFAIPSNTARLVLDQLLHGGKVDRGWLGVTIRDLTAELASEHRFAGTEGVLIQSVVPDGPASAAGVEAGDIVVELDGRPMKRSEQFRSAVAALKPGTRVEIQVFRDGAKIAIPVTTGSWEKAAPLLGGEAGGEARVESLGLAVRTLDRELAESLGVEGGAGVVVTEVAGRSLAGLAGIRPRDVILAVGDEELDSAEEFARLVASSDLRRGIDLQVSRRGNLIWIRLQSTR